MQRLKKLGGVVGILGLALSVVAATPVEARPASASSTSSYIVQVDPAAGPVADVVAAAVAPLGGTVGQVFTKAINGAVVTLPPSAVAGLLAVPGVVDVSPNGTMRVTQANPPWGLDRTDQRNLPLNASYSFTTQGTGVKAYVIDTGIRTTHTEFGGQASSGFDAIDGGPADDCHGHGTHVSGTIGGTTYGVAKDVSLIAVRVLGCDGSGTNAQVVSGIEWVIGNHQAGQAAVANMSLGGSANTAIDTAIRNLYNDGVTVVVAAGNDAADVCASSPARVPEAITVAASDTNDAMASFSNGGTCVDLFAPGVNVVSVGFSSDTATATMSGTSMSSPHVAGAAARVLQTNPGAPPATVAATLTSGATANKITGAGRKCTILFVGCRPATANNRLLFLDPAA